MNGSHIMKPKGTKASLETQTHANIHFHSHKHLTSDKYSILKTKTSKLVNQMQTGPNIYQDSKGYHQNGNTERMSNRQYEPKRISSSLRFIR